jgi:lauroyl/myristoyl acyltransferase
MLSLLTYRGLGALCNRLPLGLQYLLARRFADVGYLVAARSRAALQANLRVVLGSQAPEREVRRCAREAFRSFGMYLCEFFGVARFDARWIAEHVRVVGREHLDGALALGRGLIFVSGHYSNWELGAFVVGRLGYPILIIAQTHADPRVNALFVGARAKHGVEVVPSALGARVALRALRQNRPVAILADRPTGGPTWSLDLCGRPTEFPQGPWRIALHSGAPLLPTFMHREPDRGYTLEFGAPLTVRTDGTDEERARALAESFARCWEQRLRADPTQWATFQPVWSVPALAGRAAAAPAPALRHAEART